MLLSISNIGKQYQENVWGLRHVDLQVKPGILGLLGPNGAGKSTLMRLLATISEPSEGTITWNGVGIHENPEEIRRILGYLPQDFGVYPHLSAHEFLNYMAAVKGISGKAAEKRIDELLGLLHLYDVRKRRIGSFSGGMKQRIGIAQALLNDPKLLIIDEPTIGLDPAERLSFRNLLTDLSGERLIIFSTHIVSDIEATADRIAILSKGRLISDSNPGELLRHVQGKVWNVVIPESQLQEARAKWLISATVRREDGLLLRVVSETPPNEQATAVHAGIEDAYLYLSAG
ncbi:ABC transporter ATP-binding protein [Paenibacillus chitinolyticus]|uniref:ABC transporter ATP-binding protein n=1 Tax=Paenibacillus chitinolyticus TaxID=79263 RepID=UPI0037C6732E